MDDRSSFSSDTILALARFLSDLRNSSSPDWGEGGCFGCLSDDLGRVLDVVGEVGFDWEVCV